MPMTYRLAAKLIKRMGGHFGYHGAEHDMYYAKNGTPIPVPRHSGDFSPGVEKDIKRRLGLK